MVLEAEKLLIEIYGEDTVEERPYCVLYDEKYGAFMEHCLCFMAEERRIC